MSASGPPPRVSVCIPSHNAAAFLPAAIDSVLAQDYADFELVVSDDASSDGTPDVCVRYRDPRFRAVRSEERLGQAGNWNRCLELARGDYVIVLHADDELLPGYLKRAAGVLDAHEDVGLVHCAVEHIDEGGAGLHVQRLFDADVVDRDGAVLRRLLLEGCVINPAGVLARREAFAEAGAFTDRIVWGVDWHMWIRIALRRPVAYLAEPLARYREHGHSGTTSVMASGRNARDETWVVQDVYPLIEQLRPELGPLRPATVRGVAHRTWCFAETACQEGDMAAARAGLRNAVALAPAMVVQPRVWGLWAATYTGYKYFAAAHAGKARVARALSGR